jgi:hypothetical protein
MRIDEIDLYGDFKINGLTGTTGQFLGMSGSDLVWLDAAAPTGGMSVYGSRYVYCNSVTYSATMSGQILKEAYASASTIGGLSADTRAAVLISPGTYDFDTSALQLTDSFIDLVGINSDANSVRLHATFADYVLYLSGGGVDTGLHNLTIGTSSISNLFSDGNNPYYIRWNNIINIGELSSTSDGGSAITLDGEFRNIKVYGAMYPFYTIGNLTGIYDNIEIYDSFLRTFSTDSSPIIGTFSNIKIYGSSFQSFVPGGFDLVGYFDNIKIYQTSDYAFVSPNLNGIFKNIDIVSGHSSFNGDNFIDGTFDNITIGSASQSSFYSNVGHIAGTFSNIQIGDCGEFCFSGYNYVSGSFDNITVGNVGPGLPNNSGKLFHSPNGYIDGKFKNIKFGTTLEGTDGLGQFFGCVGTVSGTFENIEGKEAGVAFWTTNLNSDDIVGTFSNIKFGNITGVLFMAENSGSINGTFENITCATVSAELFYSTENLSGTFKDITIGNSTTAFKAFGGNIDGIYQDITVGNTGDIFVVNGNITGTFENIKFGNVDSAFKGYDLTGTFKNIDGGTFSITTDIFYAVNNLSGVYKNIELGTLLNGYNNVFYGNTIDGTFEDIKMDATAGVIINIFYSADTLTGVFKNIDTNTFGPGSLSLVIDNFFAATSIYGTFSNISAGGISNAFSAAPLYGTFTDLKINADTTLFSLAGAGNPIIKNSILYGRLGLKGGTLVDSTVDYNHGIGSSARAVVIQNGATIERCKLLTNGSADSVYSGSAVNAKISLTITNKAFNGNVTNLISTPNNIIDASIS